MRIFSNSDVTPTKILYAFALNILKLVKSFKLRHCFLIRLYGRNTLEFVCKVIQEEFTVNKSYTLHNEIYTKKILFKN